MSQPNQPEDALEQGLKELHERLWQQLQSGLSWSDTESVLLDILARSSHLLEQHVSMPEFNTPWETVRARVVDVYARLAKLLGRNTPEAVRVDTKAMIQKIADKIQFTSHRGRASRGTLDHSSYIKDIVVPYLDEDQRPLANDMTIYHIPQIPFLMKFYRTVRRSESRKKTKKIMTILEYSVLASYRFL